uniref:cellulase n=1 Tax=Aegilops tauschii TaxID=37682 RepID=M8D2G9_AEGTA
MARLAIASAAVALLVLLAAASAEASPAWSDYAGAFDKSLQFFEAQRSGKLPADRTVHWRGDSALTDGFSQGVDLVGGYYDAGDHVKFGFPMAYAVTMLSWGVLEFEKEMVAANSLNRALDAIRWGTNYFIKAHTEPNTLWVQVGDGDSDHLCWERAEDMSTPRTASKIDASRPGSEVAAETAAALAAAAKVFRHYDSMYADLLLMHAKQIFTFADTFRGRYDDSLQCAKKFYPSASGYQDELLWGAAWLYEATGDEDYLDYVARNAEAFGGTGWAVREFSWDNKYAGVQVLLSKVLLAGGGDGDYADTLKQFRAKAEFFIPGYQPPPGSLHIGGAPLEFVHAVTNSWEHNGVDHYRHTVTAKNTCGHPITYLKLRIEGLTGPIYGVSATHDKEMYGFPSWVTRLDAGEKLTIVYIQEGGPAAKIAVAEYKTG